MVVGSVNDIAMSEGGEASLKEITNCMHYIIVKWFRHREVVIYVWIWKHYHTSLIQQDIWFCRILENLENTRKF